MLHVSAAVMTAAVCVLVLISLPKHKIVQDPEFSRRADTINILALAIENYRGKYQADPASFNDLFMVDEGVWSDGQKELMVYPDWAQKYCDSHEAVLGKADEHGPRRSPYHFFSERGTEFIIAEKHSVPAFHGKRWAVERATLKVVAREGRAGSD